MTEEPQSHRATENWTEEVLFKKTDAIIGLGIEVHRICGPGLLEKVYRDCLAFELVNAGHSVQVEVPFRYRYKSSNIIFDFRIDLLVDATIVLELKSVPKLLPVHEAQLLTYLKLSGYPCGLLMNFYVPLLTQGIIRKTNYTKIIKT